MITITDFGQHHGQKVYKYTLQNKNDTRLGVLNFAGILQEFSVATPSGERVNLVLSSDKLENLLADYNINRVIGRTAGRIRNGQWVQNGQQITTPSNENGHTLHGGAQGLGEQFFEVTINESNNSVTLYRKQTSDDDGFPGTLDVSVTYQLTADDRVIITFTGTQFDTDGVFNPTVHTYFNLANKEEQPVLEHDLWLNSTQHLAVNHDKVPTGGLIDNADSLFDLKNHSDLGQALHSLQETTSEGGFDDVFLVRPDLTTPIGYLEDRHSGRRITIYSDRNAAVIFTAGQLDSQVVKNLNRGYGHPSLAVAIEAQTAPNSENLRALGDTFLPAGEKRTHTIIYAYTQK
ncbi:aldose epimerase family protein [Leuconostoc citreum]